MEQLTEEAFRIAILTEISSYQLYRNAAALIPSGAGKEVFDRLAREEWKLIEEILQHCPALTDSVQASGNISLPCLPHFYVQSPERRLFNHLRIALLHQNACIDRYATFVATLRDPAVCQVFQLALGIARRHYALIAEEYRKADQRLHRPGAYRRGKRTHLRGVSHPAPNKHSQLFISLLDSGRPSPF